MPTQSYSQLQDGDKEGFASYCAEFSKPYSKTLVVQVDAVDFMGDVDPQWIQRAAR